MKNKYFLGDENCKVMLGHYFFFLGNVHGSIYIWIGAIFAKLNGLGLENYRENSHCFLGINILLSWLSTKYHYFLTFEILVYVIAMLFRSMAYFYSLLGRLMI